MEKFSAPEKKYLPLGHNTQEGVAEYPIAKDRLVLVYAPYVPHVSFFYQGQKHFIPNFIRGMFKGGGGIYPL